MNSDASTTCSCCVPHACHETTLVVPFSVLPTRYVSVFFHRPVQFFSSRRCTSSRKPLSTFQSTLHSALYARAHVKKHHHRTKKTPGHHPHVLAFLLLSQCPLDTLAALRNSGELSNVWWGLPICCVLLGQPLYWHGASFQPHSTPFCFSSARKEELRQHVSGVHQVG